jgi:alpha-mannosidase
MVTIHLIPNSHLDPVWLWTWKEGAAEAIATVRSVLRLMDEFKELTYIRGEAWVYEVIERHAPKMIDAIGSLVEQGRWDIVGGNYIQPDTNLPHTEALLRQFSIGQDYFEKRFHRRATVAWAADSFGHSAGWPEIYSTAGLRYFAFSRPGQNCLTLPGDNAGFIWRGTGSSRVLCHRLPIEWYGNERGDLMARLDLALEKSAEKTWQHIPVYFGLGDHGGGPTRRHLEDIAAWRCCHPDVNVRYSTLSKFFSEWEEAISAGETPQPVEYRGELNYCLRGTYSSATRIKSAYRKAENALLRAERISTVVGGSDASEKNSALWKELLFNAFHDILPGTATEEALDQAERQIGGISHAAEVMETESLLQFAQQVKIRVPETKWDRPKAVPHLVFNPHPYVLKTWVEIESALDYRPLFDVAEKEVVLDVRENGGTPLTFQRLEVTHNFMRDLLWRVRVLVKVTLPPLGWIVVSIGFKDSIRRSTRSAKPVVVGWEGNRAKKTFSFDERKVITHGSSMVLSERKRRPLSLRITCFDDPWGPWGGHYEEKESLQLAPVIAHWKIIEARWIESGPYRVSVWTRWEGEGGSLELTIRWHRSRSAFEIEGRLLFDHRRARIKLMIGKADAAQFEVPAGRIHRKGDGEVPGGRWIKALADGKPSFVFASNAFYGFSISQKQLGVTLARSGRYCSDLSVDRRDSPWNPPIDRGVFRFSCWIKPGKTDANAFSEALEMPPVIQMTDPHEGRLPSTGSFMKLYPSTVKLLALKPAANGKGMVLRVQSCCKKRVEVSMDWKGKRMSLGPIAGESIASFRMSKNIWRPASITD